jgi:hypothetical protein
VKPNFPILIPLVVLCSAASFGQDEAKPVHPTSFIESRQGNHPDGPDMIGHASVVKDDTLFCMLVEVYDETHTASTACVIKFKDGGKRTLTQGQFIKSSENGEALLTCSGHVPRRCMIEVNDPINQPPVKQRPKQEPGDPSL